MLQNAGNRLKPPKNAGNRRKPPETAGNRRKTPENTGKHRKTPENTGKHRKTPENTGKRRKYPELEISLRGTKYLGGLKKPAPFSEDINRTKIGGPGPPFPLKTFCLVSSWIYLSYCRMCFFVFWQELASLGWPLLVGEDWIGGERGRQY